MIELGRSIRSLLLLLGMATVAGAQEFNRLEGPALEGVPQGREPSESLTIAQLAALPTPFRDARSPVIVVRTDQGNLARLVVAPAFRKPAAGTGDPFPVFILERFETFASPGGRDRLAHGRDVTLFRGLPIDLDSGQIVPPGEGGDLENAAEGEPRLRTVATARMFTIEKPPIPDDSGFRPTPGRSVRPNDFQGRYRLFGNGQWSGLLELSVRDGDVSGMFRSDQTGSSYPVSGQVGSPSNRIRFVVTPPRTRLEYDGYLFGDGKGAIAGSFQMLNRPYGFFAVREHGAISPDGDGAEADAIGAAGTAPPALSFALKAGKIRLDGRELDPDALDQAVRDAIAAAPESSVLLTIPADEPYRNVAQVLERIRDLGIDSIRIKTEESVP